MIESLKALFRKPGDTDPEELQRQLRLAAAALLIEMTRADYTVDSAEKQAMENALQTALKLSVDEVKKLLALAGTAADRATSLYEFTRLINDHYSREEKLELIESMWRVAFSDGDLDKYEERLIRQVSDLVHVPHKEFIRLKLKIAEEQPAAG